jgi:hypothetical protein
MRSSFQLSSFSQGSQESEDVRIVRKYDWYSSKLTFKSHFLPHSSPDSKICIPNRLLARRPRIRG